MKRSKLIIPFFLTVLTVLAIVGFFGARNFQKEDQARGLTLYWFIPDGLRAEPVTFKLYEWAENGDLPNIKKLMEEGSYGYSIPVFPGHTPVNFATLLTGTEANVHGVSDGSMHFPGSPLWFSSRGGFSSTSKKVPPIWMALEENNYLVSLLAVPGSTPPELNRGVTIRGRWGGWGVEFPAVIFQVDSKKLSTDTALTKFRKGRRPINWSLDLPTSFSPAFEVDLSNYGQPLFGFVIDSTNDGISNYDQVLFSKDKKSVLSSMEEGEWSGWLPVDLSADSMKLSTQLKIKVIKLGGEKFLRVRLVYNSLNPFLVAPSSLYKELEGRLGPMVDFVDNTPAQLIYYPEDKDTFIEESKLSLDWHKRAVSFLTDDVKSNVVIHNIYTPNQMLVSRWWMGYLDPKSPRYHEIDEQKRSQLWREVKDMYRGIDKIVGEILKKRNENTYIVLSSDHGAVPLHTEVYVNNVLRKEGLLKLKKDPRTGKKLIDWENSKAIYLKMNNIFIHSKGLGGNYQPDSGMDYERLRSRVAEIMANLKDKNGVSPVTKIVKREDASSLNLPPESVGDLILANRSGYGWIETVTDDMRFFDRSLTTGYKQGVMASHEQGLWTPFIVSGPGIKRNHRLKGPIQHSSQFATILKMLNIEPRGQGVYKPIVEIFE